MLYEVHHFNLACVVSDNLARDVSSLTRVVSIYTCCFYLHVFFRYLVEQQCIKPLCDLLNVNDGKIIHVALDGLDNILRAGNEEFNSDPNLTTNPYCLLIEEGDGEFLKYLI